MTERTEVLVVGGGQAGIAMSEHLSAHGMSHIVLERGRIAERWRTERWDSLVANGPAWHDRFPNMEFPNFDPEGFPPKESIADYFVAYAEQLQAPIRCGVEVIEVKKQIGETGFFAETTAGRLLADYVVAATGPFQLPIIPPIVPSDTDVLQLHSSDYKNPDQLPPGAVLVVGAGSSGGQIADELMQVGRIVYLSVGPHDRPPRRYRGRDFVWWLGVLGKWDALTPEAGAAHVTISVSGARGGQTVDFRRFAEQGMRLTGMTASFSNGVLQFARDLGNNIARGDANYLSVLKEADAFIIRNGLDLPEEPSAHNVGPLPQAAIDPMLELNLQTADVSTIIWATGFAMDFDWLKVDTFDSEGRPQHQRGVAMEPGVYFLGLPWLSRRGSSFIWGVWHDAKYLADQIAIRRQYLSG